MAGSTPGRAPSLGYLDRLAARGRGDVPGLRPRSDLWVLAPVPETRADAPAAVVERQEPPPPATQTTSSARTSNQSLPSVAPSAPGGRTPTPAPWTPPTTPVGGRLTYPAGQGDPGPVRPTPPPASGATPPPSGDTPVRPDRRDVPAPAAEPHPPTGRRDTRAPHVEPAPRRAETAPVASTSAATPVRPLATAPPAGAGPATTATGGRQRNPEPRHTEPVSIDIVIDRVDVRLPTAPARTAARPEQPRAPRLGLAEYLESRGAR